MERLSRRQLGPRAHHSCQSKVTYHHPCPPPLARWRSETQAHPCQKEEKEPFELRRVEWPPESCQRGSLGRGQVEGGQRVGGLCDKRGGPVTEVARGGKPVLRMGKEALYQRSQEQRGKLFASGQIPRCDPRLHSRVPAGFAFKSLLRETTWPRILEAALVPAE